MKADSLSRRLATAAVASALVAVVFLALGAFTVGLPEETTCALGWNNPWSVIGMIVPAVGAVLGFVAFIRVRWAAIRSGRSYSLVATLFLFLFAVVSALAITSIVIATLGPFCP